MSTLPFHTRSSITGVGLDDLLDAGQFHGLGRFAVGQHHFAIRRSLQGFGFLTGVGILLDQQFLIALQGFHLLPIHRDSPRIVGLDQQLATVEELDLAGQAVTVL
jgi:hypothetical protein